MGVTVVRRPARGYAAADMAHGLCAGVGVVRVRVGGGDGLVGGCRGHRTRVRNGLAIHCLVADLGVGIGDGLGLDLSGVLLGNGLVLVLVLVVLVLVLMLVLMLHLVLRNGLHRHRRTHAHVEG